jgi:hypothetical protein
MPSAICRVTLLCLLCGACAATRPAGAPPISPDAANGQGIVAVLGTPVHALFKATGCVLTTIFVVPSAALLAMTDRPQRVEEQAWLYDGLGRNCYGSYAMEPI